MAAPPNDCAEPLDDLPLTSAETSGSLRPALGPDEEVAAAVHEAQNALTSVLGWVDLARESASPEVRTRALDVIRRGLVRARGLVAAVADPGARLRVDIAAFEVGGVLEEVYELLHPRCVARGVELRVEPAAEALVARGDPERVVQVLTNLVLNALDAVLAAEARGRDGAGVVALAAVPRGGHVGVAVRDNGVGMDAATQARMFEPYFTSHPAPAGARARGSGLGLAVSQALADAMGAVLEVRSALDRGTDVTLWLPCGGAGPVSDVGPREARGSLAGRRVLVVDDEPAIRELLEIALTLRGARVDAVGAPPAARDVLAAQPVDVVLVDETLGRDVSGAAFIAEVARAWPRVGRVLMTGAPAVAPPATGARFVRKPFLLDDVVRELVGALDDGDGG